MKGLTNSHFGIRPQCFAYFFLFIRQLNYRQTNARTAANIDMKRIAGLFLYYLLSDVSISTLSVHTIIIG